MPALLLRATSARHSMSPAGRGGGRGGRGGRVGRRPRHAGSRSAARGAGVGQRGGAVRRGGAGRRGGAARERAARGAQRAACATQRARPSRVPPRARRSRRAPGGPSRRAVRASTHAGRRGGPWPRPTHAWEEPPAPPASPSTMHSCSLKRPLDLRHTEHICRPSLASGVAGVMGVVWGREGEGGIWFGALGWVQQKWWGARPWPRGARRAARGRGAARRADRRAPCAGASIPRPPGSAGPRARKARRGARVGAWGEGEGAGDGGRGRGRGPWAGAGAAGEAGGGSGAAGGGGVA
jgi:hypothetical protein